MSTKIGSTNVLPIFFVQKSLTNEGIVAYIYQYKKRELRLIVPSYFFFDGNSFVSKKSCTFAYVINKRIYYGKEEST